MKKLISLLLVLVMALGICAVTTNAASAKITDLDAAVLPKGDQEVFSYDQDIEPGEEIVFQSGAYFAMFDYDMPSGYDDDFSGFFDYIDDIWDKSGESAAEKAAKKIAETMEIRTRIRSGSQVIDSVKVNGVDLKGNHASVMAAATDWVIDFKVTAIDPFVSVSDVDFEIDFYFVLDGHRTDDRLIYNYTGNFANEVTECDADSVEVDTSRGQVAKATEYVGDIDLDAGNGVWAHIKMANSKKIYFRSYTDGDAKDEPIFDKYPSIEFAYSIKHVGMNSYSGKIISLEDVDDTAYIYTKGADGGLKLLGRGGEMLPFAEKYYVSNAKIDLEEDVVVEPDDIDPPEENLNPHTGR